jgi:hypothetical protein
LTRKKKILIIISNDLFVRNYISTYAFSHLQNDANCKFLFSDKILNRNFENFSNFEYDCFKIDSKVEKKHFDLYNILMWRHKSKSKSFRFRAKRIYQFKPEPIRNFQNIFFWFIYIFKYITNYILNFLKKTLFGSNFFFPVYFWFIKHELPINLQLKKAVLDFEPDLVLFPSSAYDPISNDIVILCKQFGIKTLFLVDNWDNLSSKSILWNKPQHVAVWGEQSKEHAIQIQGFKKQNVHLIGTPRYDSYFSLSNTNLQSPYDFKYILFVGTFLEFDEPGALRKLNDYIKNNENHFNGVKIVYRPHPWRSGKDTIVNDNLEFIEIDKQVRGAYLKSDNSIENQPNIDYYPNLIHNAEFVIGGLTSMLIEALIFNKRYLALVYNDGLNKYSQNIVLKNYTHFEGIDKLEYVSFCHNISELTNVFFEIWENKNCINVESNKQQIEYFYYNDELTYQERLNKLCNKIMN